MICEHPFYSDKILDCFGDRIAIPCGHCAPCIVNKQQSLCDRMLLESFYHPVMSFVTLTYDDDHLRIFPGSDRATLCREDLHRYLDVIRHYKLPKFSYFCCGEYGDRFSRPHYHCIFFGLDYQLHRSFFEDHWKFGSILSLPVSSGSFRYVAKYVSSPSDSQTFQDYGVEPPFHIMSRGLGTKGFIDGLNNLRADGTFVLRNKVFYMPRYYFNKLVDFNDQFVVDHENSYASKLRSSSFEASRFGLSFKDYDSLLRSSSADALRSKSLNKKSSL